MAQNSLRDFWIHVVGVDRPKRPPLDMPTPDGEDIETAERQAEIAERQAVAAERAAEAAELKVQGMQRLKAVHAAYKAAIAEPGPDTERLQMLLAMIKTSLAANRFGQALEGLDLLESLVGDSSASPGGDDDHDMPARRHGTDEGANGIIIEGCIPGTRDYEVPEHSHGEGVDERPAEWHRQPPGSHARPSVHQLPPDQYVGPTTCAEVPPGEYVGPTTCVDFPPVASSPPPQPPSCAPPQPQAQSYQPPPPPQPFQERDLAWVQCTLKNLGYDPGPIDGVNGPRTMQAIKAFQADHGLAVDGVVGPATLAALEQASSGCGCPPPVKPHGTNAPPPVQPYVNHIDKVEPWVNHVGPAPEPPFGQGPCATPDQTPPAPTSSPEGLTATEKVVGIVGGILGGPALGAAAAGMVVNMSDRPGDKKAEELAGLTGAAIMGTLGAVTGAAAGIATGALVGVASGGIGSVPLAIAGGIAGGLSGGATGADFGYGKAKDLAHGMLSPSSDTASPPPAAGPSAMVPEQSVVDQLSKAAHGVIETVEANAGSAVN